MDTRYTQANKIYEELETSTSSLELARINKEASEEKDTEKLIITKLRYALACLGLSSVTKKTQLQMQQILINKKDDLAGIVSFDEIKQAYYEERQLAQKVHPILFNATKSEEVMRSILKKETRMKMDKAVLFGKSSLDIYLHSIAVALEVDGDFHNHEAKMIRDHFKIRICGILGIQVMSVPNGDIDSPQVQNFVKNVNTLPVLNSKKRREIFLSLMIYSLLVRKPKFLESYLGINLNQLTLLSLNGVEKMLVRNPLTAKQLRNMKRIMIRY